MRLFSLKNSEYEVPSSIPYVLDWGILPHRIYNQIRYRQQFLEFYKYIIENLQSVPKESPDWKPLPLSLSVRAGAVHSYIVISVSIIETILAGLGEIKEIVAKPKTLYGQTYGKILRAWMQDNIPRKEVAPIWEELELLRKYRNHLHIDNAASDNDSSWQEVLEQERNLFSASAKVLKHLSELCNASIDNR